MVNKKASMTGRDLRFGKSWPANMPTQDSQQYSQKLLNQGQRVAEVGPTPNMSKPKGPDIKDLTPPSTTTKGDLPKIGADMSDKISNDPLVLHLQKHAEQLQDNLEDLQKAENQPAPRQVYPVGFTGPVESAAKKDRDDSLQSLFDNASAAREFGLDRDKH